MHCATNHCTQGKQPCPTPYQCGLTRRVDHFDTLESRMADTPITTPEDEMSRPLFALVVFMCLVLSLVILAITINAARAV